MAETSRDRVTITLGRRGQVVKRGVLKSNASFGDSAPAVAGTKRSVRDRLGSSGDGHSNRSLFNGIAKRQRGDNGTASARANGLNGGRLGNQDGLIDKDDLRLKLMKKSASKQARSNENRKFSGDLRDKLKKTRRISTVDSSQQRYQTDRKVIRGSGQAPSSRSSNDHLSKMDLRRESYSSWASDHYNQRSPDRVPHGFRALSERNVEDTQRITLSRNYDDIGSAQYMSGNNVIGTQRPMTSVAFQSRPVIPLSSLKPAALPNLSQLPLPSSLVPKSSYVVEEQQTVDGLLHSLGLGKYVVIFKAEEVDMTALKQMGENDLKELGIPMGPRKKIILALLTRSKKHP